MAESTFLDSGGIKDIQGVFLISPSTHSPVEPSGGGGATVATVDNIVMQDTDGTLFFKRVTGDTPPVITNWKLSDGTAYTVTGTPVPFVVATTNIVGSVEITNDVGNDVNTKARIWDGTNNVQILQYNSATTGAMYAVATSAVIHGLTTGGGGGYVDVKVTPSGALTVESTIAQLPSTLGQKTTANSLAVVPASDSVQSIKPSPNNRSAFADLVTVPRTPINQHGFIHGLYADNVLFGQSGAGALTTVSKGRLSITSGTASGGFAWFSSERPIIYRQGQGVCDRFTCIFGTPTASIFQFKGVASYAAASPSVPIDAVGFCYYVGTALTNDTPTAYDGTTFGILHRNFSSGSTVNTFYPQSDWNVDKLDGTGLSGLTWDKTKGNLVEVLYGHQGYSGFVFLWYLPDQHEYVVCHQIPYANTNVEMHFSNPNVKHYELMINSAAVSATTMFTGSIASFLDGERVITSRPMSFDNNSPTANINGYSSICAIQMATTFNGAPVRGIVRILGISVACHTGNGIIRTLIGATVTGQTTFTAIEPATATVTGSSGNYTIATSGGANTFASCPVLGNTTVGAVTAVSKVQGKGLTLHTTGNEYIDLKDDNVYITAGQIFTVAANTAANATFTASIHFVVEI